MIEYPVGNFIRDAGWRGETYYFLSNPGLSPCGRACPGKDKVDNIFTCLSENNFRVTVIGPGRGLSGFNRFDAESRDLCSFDPFPST